MAHTQSAKPPGPFGTLQRLYVHLPASEVAPADLDGTPLSYSGTRPDGTLVALYERRTMKPEDDETATHELSVILWQFLGLDNEWKVDWSRYATYRITQPPRPVAVPLTLAEQLKFGRLII